MGENLVNLVLSELTPYHYEICAVCLETIDGRNVGVTPCRHTFHYECIVQAIRQSRGGPRCPYCNRPAHEQNVTRLVIQPPTWDELNDQVF